MSAAWNASAPRSAAWSNNSTTAHRFAMPETAQTFHEHTFEDRLVAFLQALHRGERPDLSRAAGALGPLPGGDDGPPPDGPGYEIVGELGRGGMGVVYKARQCALRRTVALKMIRGPGAADPAFATRFRAEAEALARLAHPNIVTIYEIGTAAAGPYFALEYVAGESLAERLAR